MYYTYIIYSKSINQYYTGQTENLEERISQHRSGVSKSTRKVDDWVLVYFETYLTRSDAYNRETEIKKKKSRKYIEWLINQKA